MSAKNSQNDFEAVRSALESIFEENEVTRRRLYEKGELFNDNFIRISVVDLHRSIENTSRRKLPKLVENVLADFNFRGIHGDWALVKHDAPDFTLIELPHSATNVVGITFSAKGYKGNLIELGDETFGKPEAPAPQPEKPKATPPKNKKEVVSKPTESKKQVEEEVQHEAVERAPATLLDNKRRRVKAEKLSPEERREASGTYQQLKFLLLSLPMETLTDLAETLNIGDVTAPVQNAVNEILEYLDFSSVVDAAENMGITLKARNSADAALLEFLINQSK